jgi:AcrR family transcriptional regulator
MIAPGEATLPDIIRKRKKSASRKAELLEIAAKIFAEQSYKETGIESILKQAGLTGPALYRHFSSKQEILDTICIASMQRGLKEALDVQSEPDLRVRLRMVMDGRSAAT